MNHPQTHRGVAIDEKERLQNEQLLRQYQRRLYFLKLRTAFLGWATPPEVYMEIEDICKEIGNLEQVIGNGISPANPADKVGELAAHDTPPTTSDSNTSLPKDAPRQEQKQKPLRILGRLLPWIFVLDFILAIYLGWYWLGERPNTSAYIQAFSAVISLILQIVFVVVFPIVARPVSRADLITRFSNSRWFSWGIPAMTVWLLSLLILTLIAGHSEAPTFDFENGITPVGQTPGWDVRWEGSNRLGESVWVDDGHAHVLWPFGHQAHSLAFQFNLREKPFNKAQVKYEVPGLRLDEELSGWVFVPDNAPEDLLASCLVLEHNTTRPNQPEYLFFQTGYTKLVPGQWSYVRCVPSDFVSVNPDVPHWVNPLLAGLEIKRANNGFYRGVAYFDDIVLR
jgi:hypothetical protein